MRRAEFFARAATHYLDELDAKSLTARMDTALDLIGGMDESAELAVNAGRRVLGDSDQWLSNGAAPIGRTWIFPMEAGRRSVAQYSSFRPTRLLTADWPLLLRP